MTDTIELVEWYEAEASRTRSGASVDPMIHAALGLCSESGEFASAVKAHIMYARALDKTNLLEELGDILWFLSLAADSIGFSLRNVMLANIAKLRKRYPDGSFSVDRANNRDTQMEIEAVKAETVDDFGPGTEVRIVDEIDRDDCCPKKVILVSDKDFIVCAFQDEKLAMQFCRDRKFVVHLD